MASATNSHGRDPCSTQERGDQSIWGLIERNANLPHRSLAVSQGEKSVSYQELAAATRRLAGLFVARGIKAGDTIPIFVSRCLETVASVLALLRLGVCYVPMDAEAWSQSRVDAVLQAIEPELVVTARNTSLKTGNIQEISAEDIRAALEGSGSELDEGSLTGLIDVDRSKDEPVYMIFTSGTTGTPKGVVIPRRCVKNYVQQGTDKGMPFNLGVGCGDKVLLLFSLAFDAAWGVFFSTLCHGGHLILSAPERLLQDVETCSILPATPSLLATIKDPESYKNIKSIFLGGESPSPGLVQGWWTPERRIFNCYGPTETTICTSMAELRPGVPITLGKPMAQTQLLLLNDQLEESSEGEICISGPGLAAGYYKNEQLTTLRFIEWQGKRIYRTGDHARRSPEGLVFCGRGDSQAKNRGYLINLEMDVVPVLLRYPGVTAAVAFMMEGKLIGCIMPELIDVTEMRRELTQSHDSFVVPDHIVAHKELPKTSNGKIDLACLQNSFMAKTGVAADPGVENQERLSVLRDAVADALGLHINLVSTHGSFWELGGNSLRAIKLMSNLRHKGFTMHFQDLFGPVSLAVLSERLEQVSGINEQQKPDAELLLEVENAARSKRGIIAPMTMTQTGMIRSSLQHSAASYMLVSITFPWSLDMGYKERIRNAWQEVMRRHSMFRTVFDPLNGVQRVEGDFPLEWEEHCVADCDFSLAIESQSSELLQLTQKQEKSDVFRPLNAFRLLTSSSTTEAVLLWLVHHSRVDGWSMGLIMEEVQAILQGKALQEPPQFWQLAQKIPRHINDIQNEGNQFWKEAMKTVSDAGSLNLPKPVTPNSESRFGETRVSVDLPLPQLEQICHMEGVTSAVMIYAAWALLLKSYTGHDQLVFGTVYSGRNLNFPGIDQMVGPILNTCPLPVSLAGLASKADLLTYIGDTVLQVGVHQWSAAESLQKIKLGSHSGIFQTMLFLEYDLPSFSGSGWKCGRQDVPEFGLTILIRRDGENLSLSALFDQTMYTRPVIERMMQHFRNILLALLDPKCTKSSEVCDRMLNSAEFLRLTHNSPTLLNPYIGPSNLKDCFERGVDQWPDEIAIESLTQSVTYRELDLWANHAARAIADCVRPGDPITILSDRSLEWVISVFATIKAGTLYVPLDTKLPIERMRSISKSAGAKICIFPNEDCYRRFSEAASEETLLLHEVLSTPCTKQSSIRLETVTKPKDIAYIIFTSGSTGVPKGVAIEHQSVVSYLSYGPARMDARPGRRHAQMFSPGFDVNMAEIFGTLCHGATLVLADPTDPFAHLSRVHATMITPSFLSVCDPNEFPDLDTILFAGEAVPQILADRWSGNRTVYNSYGPCECTIGCLFQPLQPGREVTLGRTIPRVGVYLLDSHSRPVPIGVPGEICLSGIQVSTGYLGAGMGELSKTRFLADPFVQGQRMYRTGDRAVWTEDMEPRFLGRVDNQVKVRGFRIELEEIESAIRVVTPEVRRAAAIVSGNNIVAFVEPETVPIQAIHEALQSKLPSYACPSSIVALPALPTTPNQKLDRKTLQSYPVLTGKRSQVSLTKLQSSLAKIWREAIGLPDEMVIEPDDDFLVLGGNSLSQIKVAQKICGILNEKLPLTIFIRNTTLLTLSAEIEEYLAMQNKKPASNMSFTAAWRSIEPPYTEVSHLEEEFVKLSLSSSSPQAFNVAYKVRLTGDVNVEVLEKAIAVVLNREKIFQVCFEITENRVSRCQSQKNCKVSKAQTSKITITDFVNQEFDLFLGPLTRIMTDQHPDGVSIIIVQHHSITDKVAIKIFFSKVQELYRMALQEGIGPGFENRNSQVAADYRIWAKWKASQIESAPEPHIAYWNDHMSGLPAPLFPLVGKHMHDSIGASDSFILGSDRILSGSMELYVTLSALALAKATGNKDLVVGIPYIDRMEPGTEDLLGVFLDRLPVRIRNIDMALARPMDLISIVRNSIRDALAYSIPFKAIRRLAGEGTVFQVMIVYNGKDDSVANSFSLPGILAEDVALRASGAKFPLLIEFTETERGTICELEYMEHLVSTATIGTIRQQLESIYPLL
ncbi:hypothetical protein AOCH_001363, partial [Aspergillus ochraceoroseus]